MLDQYILNCLKENDIKLDKLKEKLKRLKLEEESCNHMIDKLLETGDMGLELFSPRNSMDSSRQKISDIKNQLKDIQFQQAETTEELEKAKSEESKYQQMLSEIRNKQNSESLQKEEIEADSKPKSEIEEDTEKRYQSFNEREELKNILARVDKSLSLLYTDKSHCKNELINLKYYLKALISSK